MGSGNKGLYYGTYGSRAVPGSSNYMDPEDRFSRYIRKRKDIDVDGFYDIIAHGSSREIYVFHNGKSVGIDHRTAAKLFSRDKNYHGGPIRLLSCYTGYSDNGFAQNLANKLNVPVKAPNDYLWSRPSGNHFVAAGKYNRKGELIEDLSHKGMMKTFYPQGRKRK